MAFPRKEGIGRFSSSLLLGRDNFVLFLYLSLFTQMKSGKSLFVYRGTVNLSLTVLSNIRDLQPFNVREKGREGEDKEESRTSIPLSVSFCLDSVLSFLLSCDSGDRDLT